MRKRRGGYRRALELAPTDAERRFLARAAIRAVADPISLRCPSGPRPVRLTGKRRDIAAARPGGSDATLTIVSLDPPGQADARAVCLAGFLDFVDTTIVNVALPSIRHGLGFSVANLQWVISGYLLTYGGLHAARRPRRRPARPPPAARRRHIAVRASPRSPAGSPAATRVMIAARLAQGLGAAMMTPAALSILTTSFTDGHRPDQSARHLERDRPARLGARRHPRRDPVPRPRLALRCSSSTCRSPRSS